MDKTSWAYSMLGHCFRIKFFKSVLAYSLFHSFPPRQAGERTGQLGPRADDGARRPWTIESDIGHRKTPPKWLAFTRFAYQIRARVR